LTIISGMKATRFRPSYPFRFLSGLLISIFQVTAVFGQVATPAQLNTALGTNAQAAIISLYGIDPLSCPQVSMTQTFTGGKLIFSDSPESPNMRGILYMDTNLPAATTAPNRLFVYHVNSNSASMRFSVLIQNNGPANAMLTVSQTGIAGPSTDYPYTGQVAFNRWLTNPPVAGIAVAPGQIVRLDTNFDTINVRKNYLLHGIWDYTFDQPHTVMICALNPSDDPIAVGPTLAVYPRDIHERGTFAACNKTYATASGKVIATSAGIQQFPLVGDGDAYVTGYDNAVSPGTAEVNSGNYGVLYQINLTTSASDGRALAFLINPRGGAWSGAIQSSPALTAGGAFLLPPGTTLSDDTEAVLAAAYVPGIAGRNISLQFMPTGGASFPLRMVAIPFNAIKPALAPINNYTVNPGQTVSFTAVGSDANPNEILTYSLSNAPTGATIDSASGAFLWRPPVANAGTTNTLQVLVADQSVPALAAARMFTITVNPVTPITVIPLPFQGGQFSLQVAGPAEPDYILQGGVNLANSNGWINLLTNSSPTSPFTFTDPTLPPTLNRFYRVLIGP
jgi:hypothetical protein